MHPAFLPAAWPVPKSVHGFTTLRHGAGVSRAPFDSFNLGLRSGDVEADVLRNRQQLAEFARLPSPPHWLRQVHGVDVVRCDDSAATHEPEADAAVTSTPGVVLAILTADCLPVLFAAKDGSAVGAAHAGWRGLAAGVLEATVAALHTPPDHLLAWLGPGAGPQRYEVGMEVYDAFVADDWGAGRAFTSTRPHHWHVDLYALARRRLEKAGLRAHDIHGGALCTIADPQSFYSHRRDQRTGRMASLVWMDPAR
ncbi:peptidoglycan editing factor PgeF [Lysobacter solisilvae (ex Woo and Kim 2020)]|uniref:Purine nucleoside phosphorylase n=1 Tax=Agrilutibacter terrestris TaxID=2865112 RepID=A0A7H0FZ46_9GAMM|nr:peptidoglycan editing factor PgeF [Lysobacter terrestris]QNP41312.1 peptidoglycan editing factor PgeF [Lysobacter terrestris]